MRSQFIRPIQLDDYLGHRLNRPVGLFRTIHGRYAQTTLSTNFVDSTGGLADSVRMKSAMIEAALSRISRAKRNLLQLPL